MKNTQILLILLIFLGCKERKNVIDESITDNSVKSGELVFIEKKLIDTMIFKNFSLIPLETNNESLLREIDRICIHKDRICILDNRLEKICVFDKKGKYINQIHCVGQGPEEYIAIIDFCIDENNEEILVLCDVPYKLMRFTLDGKFIRQTVSSALYTEISTYSDYLYCLLNDVKDKYEMGCFNQELQLVYKGLASRENINKDCYNRGKNLVKSKNLSYTRRFDSSLYHLSENGIEKKYEFDFGKYTIPTSITEEKDCRRLFEICQDQKYIYSITNAVESDKYILFSTNLGICLFNKETEELNGYKLIHNQTLDYGSSIYFPNEGNGNSIIGSFDPSSLSYYKESTIKSNPVIYDLIQKTKPDDNPVLIIYEFKR